MGDIALAVLLLDNSRGMWTKLESDILPEIQMRVWKTQKKRKVMTNVNMKMYVKIYVGGSHKI